MKPKDPWIFPLVVVVTAVLLPNAFATSGTWTSNVSGNWLDDTKWTSSNVPSAASEIATLGGNWTGQTLTVTTATAGQILASDSASLTGGLTISGGTLTLANGLSQPLISTGANSNFAESAALRLKISSVLDGSNGFERQGSGYLDLSGATNTFTGVVKLTAPSSGGGSFTVINSDANLGNEANSITIATNTQPVGFYSDASAGSFTLNPARAITTSGNGDFWVKNKAGVNMTLSGVISGTANFRKNDGGIVTLTAANSYALATKLDGGTLRLSGGSNRLPTTTTVQFVVSSTLDLTDTSQSVAALSVFSGGTSTITGAGGSLTVTNNANFSVNGNDTTALDLSGTTNFTFNQATRNFSVQPVTNSTASNNTITLAKGGSNNITALNLTVGGATGSSQGTAHEGRLYLGATNNVNATTVNLGGFNGSGLVAFQSGLSTPELKLRGLTGGTTRAGSVFVGSTSSGVRSGDGVMNLSGGTLDAMVTDLVINRHGASATTTQTSSLTMGGGSVDATNIVLSRKSTNFGTGAETTGNPVLNANFTQSGGTVKVSNLVMGENTNVDLINILPVLKPTYNLNGGTLYAATIDGGVGGFNTTSSIRNFNLNGGTLRNFDSSTNLTMDGVDAITGGRLNVLIGANGGTITADANRAVTLSANTRLDGSGALSKNGEGILLINGVSSTYTGVFTVNAGTLSGVTSLGGDLTIGSSGTLAPGAIDVAGNLTMAGVYAYQFTGGGSTADLVTVGGLINLSGSSVSWENLGLYDSTDKFTLFSYTSGNLSGKFNDYDDDTEYSFGGGNWLLNYDDLAAGENGGGGSRFVTLTAIPEPNLAMLLSGSAMLVLLRRRRIG